MQQRFAAHVTVVRLQTSHPTMICQAVRVCVCVCVCVCVTISDTDADLHLRMKFSDLLLKDRSHTKTLNGITIEVQKYNQ